MAPEPGPAVNIIVYCQHVLGIGHFFRTLEICRALSLHRVTLVTGGPTVQADLPDHVRLFRLPGLEMNRSFLDLRPTEPGWSLDQVKAHRKEALVSLVRSERPDVILLELYPFGRKAFRFEIDPVLEGIRQRTLPQARVVCSLRDILVERDDAPKYEARVVDTLNRYFNALAIHADPVLVRLEETFSRAPDIRIPVVYTGFVAQAPPRGARDRMRGRLGIGPEERLIVASAGGGKVGDRLLIRLLDAAPHMGAPGSVHFRIFTGPYLEDGAYRRLASLAGPRIRVERFSPDFPSLLAAADLSVSMAGYNTTMNLLSARVRALVWPFSQNREQGLRARRLAAMGALTVIEDEDLTPGRLALLMDRALAMGPVPPADLDLEGAAHTARWLEALAQDRTGS